jgi:hypothetical protein
MLIETLVNIWIKLGDICSSMVVGVQMFFVKNLTFFSTWFGETCRLLPNVYCVRDGNWSMYFSKTLLTLSEMLVIYYS